MERENTDSGIEKEIANVTNGYAFRVGFNAAVVSILADALSCDKEMRLVTLVQALAGEFATQYDVLEDPTELIDEFLSMLKDSILDNLSVCDPLNVSVVVAGYEDTFDYILGRDESDRCRDCHCKDEGD